MRVNFEVTEVSMEIENAVNNIEAWNYAIGLIKVDGLEPTEEFMKYIEKEKSGEATMDDLKSFLDEKYKKKIC